MKTGFQFDYSGFILFYSNGCFVVQNPLIPLYFNNLFLQSFYKPMHGFLTFNSLNFYGKGLIVNLKLWALFFRTIRSWLLPFRRFSLVRFELWGLGLRFQPAILNYSHYFIKNLPTQTCLYKKLNFRYWRFKIGLSHKFCFFEDLGFKFILRKNLSDFRRRIFVAISVLIEPLFYYCTILRKAKGINVYKYRGLKYSSETIKLKIGKAVRL